MGAMTTPCPGCARDYTTRVPIKSFVGKVCSHFYYYPFRCLVCDERFNAFKWGVNYVRRPVDRRQHERIPVEFQVVIKTENGTKDASVVDLSTGGCKTNASGLQVGDLVELELMMIPDQSPVYVQAAIVRFVREPFTGFEFLRLGDMERRIVSRFVTSYNEHG